MRADRMKSCLAFFLLYCFLKAQVHAVPTFENLPTSITVNETLSVDSEVLRVVSRSSDRGATPYSLSCLRSRSLPPNACEVFKLTSTSVSPEEWSGFLSLAQPLDSTRNSQYTLALNAVDSRGQSLVGTLKIIIRTTLLRPPVFSGVTEVEIDQRTTASQDQIVEFSAVGIGSLSSVYDVNYRIQEGPFKDYFRVDPVLGRLTNLKPLTYSDPLIANGLISVNIQAAYVINGQPAWNNPQTTNKTTIRIFLKDQNLNPPTFDKTSYAGNIRENAEDNTAVNSIFFNVTDLDRSQSSASFTLTLDNYNDIFQIQPASAYKQLDARLTIKTSNSFNYNEKQRVYIFNVIATESKSLERRSTSIPVTVSLIQVNRFAPQFIENPYIASVGEDANNGKLVVTVKALDKDVGDFGNTGIRYRFSTGANDRFRINTLNGDIRVSNCRTPGRTPCLDFEDNSLKNIRLIVWAVDQKGEGKTGTTTVTVNVQDVNDNRPIFAAETYFATINDSSTTLSPLIPPTLATDRDSKVLVYSIVSGDNNNVWSIDPTTGKITPNKPITYSDAPISGTFQLVIRASDSLFDTQSNVIIEVKPINRFTPVFSSPVYNTSIFETQLPNTSFVDVDASDGDNRFTPGGQLLYRITSGSRLKFQINPKTGAISLIPGQSLDFRTQPFYNLTVQVNDQGAPSRSSECIVLIYLKASRPFIGLADHTTSVRDDAPIDGVVVTLQAEKSSLRADVELEYSIVGEAKLFNRNNVEIADIKPDQRDMFKIDRSTGQVQVNKPLDGLSVSKWQASINVITDTNPPLNDEGLLIILITISNKIPPAFNPPWTVQNPVYNMTVQQGDNFREVAGSYIATPANSSLFITYKLNDPQNFFELQSPTSGIIKQKQAINQGVSNLQLILTATDNGNPPLKNTALINVFIQVINQRPPVFVKTPYTATIFDDATVGKDVIKVEATDPDEGDFGNVRYSIETNNSNFQINEISGQISVSRSGFSALLEPRILLEVQAYDSPKTLSMRKFNFAYVNVTVLDANNNAPIFQPAIYTYIIYTKEEKGNDILRVSATDADVGENARITYSIRERNDDGTFEIDSATGQIRLTKTLKRIEKNYTLSVEASDNGTPSLKGRAEVFFILKILCEDKCNPIWTLPENYLSSISVPETQAVGSVLARLEATSQTFRPLDFSFLRGGNVKNLDKNFDSFSILPGKQLNTANVTLLRKLDYNTRSSYELVMVTRDSSVDNSETLRYLVVNVLPVKQFNPRFAYDSSNFCTIPLVVKTPQNSTVGSIIEEVKATPNHIFDIIEYKIPETPKVPFSVDQNGVVRATETLESIKDYTFDIKANYKNTDNIKQTQQVCNGKDQSSVRMTVKVYKHFLSSPLSICYREDANDGTTLANLNDLLTEPLDSSRIQYHPAIKDGFEIREDGSVILQNIQKANEITNNDAKITVNMTINLLGSTVRTSPELKPHRISSGTALTLITLSSTLSDYNSQNKAVLLRSLTSNTKGSQCIVDAGFHTLSTGTVDSRLTDVYLYTFKDNKVILPMELDGVYAQVQSREDAKIVGITDAASRWGGFNWQPVAIAMGLIIGLLLLALLFFCCFCCWGYFSQWCLAKSNDKEPMISRNTGLVNRAWSSQHVLQEEPQINRQQGSINRGYPLDSPEIYPLPADSFMRRDDVTTVDGGAGSSVMGAPTGYVHIEAPLSRATSAFGARDEIDATITATLAAADSATAATTATTITEKTETMVRQEYDHNHSGEAVYNNSHSTSKTSAGARAYSSKSGGLDDINEGDDQQPVQLNDTSVPGSSQIGAVLIRPETPRGLGYTQRIVGGSENMPEQPQMTTYDYSNFDEGTLSLDPSRLNMAMQNEVMMNGVTKHSSYYDETIGTARQTDLQTNNYENNFEQFEETRYL